MTKRIAFFTAGLAVAAGAVAVARAYPADVARYTEAAAEAARRAWAGIEANPAPVALGVGTFLLTVVYHAARGKSLRESVEVAATRVTVVAAPRDPEPPVVARARARATRAQLLADQVVLQNRLRKLVEEVTRAEKDACYTEQAVADAERVLADRKKAHAAAAAKLDRLRGEWEAGEGEQAAMEAELKKLAALV